MIPVPAAAAKSIKNAMEQIFKQAIASVIIFLLTFFGRVFAVSEVSLVSSAVAPGDTVEIPLVLSTSETVAALQCHIPELPGNLRLLEVCFEKKSPLFNSWSLFSNRLYNRSIKILGFDESLNGITGDCCELARLVVTADKIASPGVYSLELGGLLVINQDGQILASNPGTGYLTVSETDVVFDLQRDSIGYYDQSTQIRILVSTFTKVAGFQFDLVDSADIFRGIDCQNPFVDGWNVDCRELDNGSLRILAFGAPDTLLSAGSIFPLIVNVGTNPDVRGGAYPVSIEKITVSDENAESLSGVGNTAGVYVDSLLPVSFDLLLPGDNYTVSAVWETQHVWQRSSFPPANEAIVYDLNIKVKNYDSPTVHYYSGPDTCATVNYLDLFTILDSLGITTKNVRELQWWVNAKTDQRSRRSESIFNLDIHDFAFVENQVGKLPDSYKFYQNYPNPFNSVTTLRFKLPKTESVNLIIYNVLGQEIQTLTEGIYSAGDYRFIWSGRNKSGRVVESGIYLVKFKAGNYHRIRKLVYLK